MYGKLAYFSSRKLAYFYDWENSIIFKCLEIATKSDNTVVTKMAQVEAHIMAQCQRCIQLYLSLSHMEKNQKSSVDWILRGGSKRYFSIWPLRYANFLSHKILDRRCFKPQWGCARYPSHQYYKSLEELYQEWVSWFLV